MMTLIHTVTLAETALKFATLFLAEIVAQRCWIRFMTSQHITQVQKAYGTHIDEQIKAKVPSMGGVVFLLIGTGMLISALLTGNYQASLFWAYPLMSGAVGLTDDSMKFTSHSSEGLKSKQKFILQAVTTSLWFALLRLSGITPFLTLHFSVGYFVWPIALFLAVGMQNAVNVTDGLDGLAASMSAITFSFCMILCAISGQIGGMGWDGALTGLAITLGFLWHNGHPAQVFMGDCGAHFLAGIMVSCALMGTGLLSLVPLGLGFGLEMLSVVIQLMAIYGWKRRVFKMSPIHHHFQLSGWAEDTIVNRFCLIHFLGVALLMSVYCAF